MAIHFECDYCGERIYSNEDWLTFKTENRSRGASADALNRMGLQELEQRIGGPTHFHLRCFRSAARLIDNHRRWAQGESEGPGGLEWRLVETDPVRRPAVLEPIHENRILDLCRARGIDRDELAEQLDTSRGAVGRWLKSHQTSYGRPVGITAKWAKRLVMFFDLDSVDDLFKREPSGDAPADEFEAVES